MADDKLLDTITCGEAENGLDGRFRVIATIASHNECRASSTSWNRLQDGLDKVLGVMLSTIASDREISVRTELIAAYLLLKDLHTEKRSSSANVLGLDRSVIMRTVYEDQTCRAFGHRMAWLRCP